MEGGADPEAVLSDGSTPLLLAAQDGHSEAMSVLIEAGATPDRGRLDGMTPLFLAAQNGYRDVIKVLLRANADPLLTRTDALGTTSVPLDIAAKNGHSQVVFELVQQVGIEGCGGATRGAEALRLASFFGHVDVMAVLRDAGVVDSGMSVVNAVRNGRELAVRFLLQQRKGDEAVYLNNRDLFGVPILLYAIGVGTVSPSPRIVRLLVDAGADTASAGWVPNDRSGADFNDTPLDLATRMLSQKKVDGKHATEEQLHKLKGIHRLLSRVGAARAVSFLWLVGIPSGTGAEEGAVRTVGTSTQLRAMLPILRRRARRPRVLLAALFRLVPCSILRHGGCCTFPGGIAKFYVGL